MCRIISISGKIKQAEISHIFDAFQRLAKYGNVSRRAKKGHKDGWGMAAYAQNRLAFFKKRPTDAYRDPKYPKAILEIVGKNPDIIIGHLRKAAVGATNKNNAQPFTWKNISFCQNGIVLDHKKISLSLKFKNIVKGTTDSERLFVFILEKLSKEKKKSPKSVISAIKKFVLFIKNNFDFTAMNILFSDGKFLWTLREVNGKNEDVKKEKLMTYYSLFLGLGKKYSVVSSEKLPIKDIKWKTIKNHELLQISPSGRIKSFSI